MHQTTAVRMLLIVILLCTDTEGSFMVERVVEITDACIRHLKKLGNSGTAAQKDAVRHIH